MSIQRGAYPVSFDEGDGAGVIKSIANPEGVDLYITRAVLDITTPSAGASTLDLGTANAAGTNGDNLIDGLSGAAAGAFDNIKNPGTNGLAGVRWESNHFVNLGEASGSVADIEGVIYLEWIRLEEE